MEESFKLRVERLFGSRLFESVPRSSFPDSSWSVTDGEVEKKEWNRERGGSFPDREDMPCPLAFDECFTKNTARSRVSKKRRFEDDLDDPDDGEEEDERERKAGGEEDGGDAEREEREIRSSIGLDSTLDYEEEEDEFDRAAVGSENGGERMYMRDVKDHGPYMNYHTVIEESSEEVHFARDSRADHFAASVRLKEDKEAGKSSQHESSPRGCALTAKITESDALKPILKRKGDQADSRPKKHVRFGLGCKEPRDEQLSGSHDLLMVPESAEAARSSESCGGLPPEDSPNVPDYIRNPSKYVRYTFGSEDDISDDSNGRAFDDFWKIVRASKSEDLQPDDSAEPPKSVTFTPRKRATDSVPTDHNTLRGNNVDIPKGSSKESGHVAARSLGIAAAEAQENEVCAMEEDTMDTPVGKNIGSQKSCRQYRSRTRSDDSAC